MGEWWVPNTPPPPSSLGKAELSSQLKGETLVPIPSSTLSLSSSTGVTLKLIDFNGTQGGWIIPCHPMGLRKGASSSAPQPRRVVSEKSVPASGSLGSDHRLGSSSWRASLVELDSELFCSLWIGALREVHLWPKAPAPWILLKGMWLSQWFF